MNGYSFAQGMARNASESEYPNLWRGLVGLWCPSVGVQGSSLIDFSQKSSNALFNTGVTWSPGRKGASVDLSSGNAYLSVANNSNFNFGTGNFTVSWWEFRIATRAGDCTIARDETNEYPAWLFGYSDGGTNLYVYMGSGGIGWNIASGEALGPVSLNTWVNFTVTRNGSSFMAYKNGIVTSMWTSSLGFTPSSLAMVIGLYISNNSYYFLGKLDDIRIHLRSLSTQEIMQSYMGASPLIRKQENIIYQIPFNTLSYNKLFLNKIYRANKIKL